MSKSSKSKKDRVPKITEEEYTQYVNALKATGQVCVQDNKTTAVAAKTTVE